MFLSPHCRPTASAPSKKAKKKPINEKAAPLSLARKDFENVVRAMERPSDWGMVKTLFQKVGNLCIQSSEHMHI